ncbi:MAG TPA: UDP-N-acetylglucosamine 2-epimerase (non-hydrolyzing) [Solirubrobacteraceae bacterium]|jgi:UDP-N-acetylglucosamine 2-epimerase (non-hydrolysing)/UDP-GlcNAc3NAcA epimerase|nr:UDP-N-acetylglucosamine 2-epimerase (non-hydrolyzing) [Solirubrobacteraceae bacterium]
MRIATIVGNRPQFVKAAAVSHRLRVAHEEILIHTGQHYDDELSRIFFEELGIPAPDLHLDLGTGTNLEQTARMLTALEAELGRLSPDAVLVYGDTNTTLAAAVTAAHLRLPLIHVEAGMRSFDHAMPEEVNRVLTDHVSGLCLCSTTVAIDNLEREGLGSVAVLVGDVMGDIALQFAALAEERSTITADHALPSGDFALLTAHRAGNVDDPARLELLVELIAALPLAVFYPVHPRTHKRLSDTGLLGRLAAAPHVTLSPPVGYLDLLKLAAHAGVVITDSGGLQKEAYVLGTRCITLRDRTEWVETVQAGWNTLVDLSASAALEALGHEPPPAHPDLYRAGRAAEGIVEAVGRWRPRLGPEDRA